jgi:hypothetical protein
METKLIPKTKAAIPSMPILRNSGSSPNQL